MQKVKKQKIQEILDAQNAAIDADMVRVYIGWLLLRYIMFDLTVR